MLRAFLEDEFYKETYEILAPKHKEMDITEINSVETYFLKYRPDYVVHCAAISDVGRCEKEQELSWKVNVIGTENIVKTAKKYGIKCICSSSDQVYFGSKEVLANKENAVLTPQNVYGREKFYTEESCLGIDDTSVHLRLAWMYDAMDASHSDFIKQLLNCSKGEDSIAFSVNDKRGITDVWEVVKNIEKTFSLLGGVYNFGSPNDKTTYDTVVSIFEKQNYDKSCIKKMEYPNSRNLTMSQEKINRYGIYFSTTEEGILRALGSLRKCSDEHNSSN